MYELWGMDTGNAINDYDTETDALRTVLRYVEANGRDAIATWVLLRSTPDGESLETVAEGSELADLALRARAGAAQ